MSLGLGADADADGDDFHSDLLADALFCWSVLVLNERCPRSVPLYWARS